MAILSDLLAKVRLELADQPNTFSKTFAGDGSTKLFTLGYKPVDTLTLTVTVNNVPVTQPIGYTPNADHGTISFTVAPEANSVIKVMGSYYRYFTDEDLTGFINTAVTQHTHNRTDQYGSQMSLSLIPPVEEYPIAVLGVIEALWALATDSAFDIDITAPDGVHIPRSERFRQLTQLIQFRTEQYQKLCSALNIGLWRIEMGVLRRVSRTTNKLVPVYMPQEIDDSRRPERVWIQNDLNGRTAMPSYAGVFDVVLVQGDSFEQEFDFPFDITDLEFKAEIRTYPNAPAVYATFDITKVDANNGKLKISLNQSSSAYLPMRAFWDLQATSSTNPNFQQTYIKGQVFVTQQVTL